MGVAAYQRGNRAISAQFCREAGCPGCLRCSERTPTPRPADWGSKVYARALKRARGLLSVAALVSDTTWDHDSMVAIIAERERCALSTAGQALAEVMNEL